MAKNKMKMKYGAHRTEKEVEKMMQMDKMTPQQKYNFVHDDGYYDESDTGAMTKEELKLFKKLGN